jgi:hypothetical protein
MDRYARWKKFRYSAPTDLTVGEIATRDILGFYGDSGAVERFDRTLYVQAMPDQGRDRAAETFYLSLLGTIGTDFVPSAALLTRNGAAGFLVGTRDALCWEELQVLREFIETLFGTSIFTVPPGSSWRSRDATTNKPVPFPSGRTWADMFMPVDQWTAESPDTSHLFRMLGSLTLDVQRS